MKFCGKNSILETPGLRCPGLISSRRLARRGLVIAILAMAFQTSGCVRIRSFTEGLIPKPKAEATATVEVTETPVVAETPTREATVTEPQPAAREEILQRYGKAKAFQSAGKNEEALAEYKAITEIESNSFFLWTQIGILQRDVGRLEESRDSLKKALEIKPDDKDANLVMGTVLYRLDKSEEAKPFFEKATQRGPQQIDAYKEMAVLYLGTGKYQEASEAFKQLLTLDPEAAISYHYNLGQCYLHLNDAENAAKEFESVLAAQPQHATIYLTLGMLYERLKKYDEAAATYKKLLERDAANVEGHKRMAMVSLLNNDHKASFKEFTTVTELDPNYLPAYHYLGLIYNQAKLYPQAEEQFKKYLERQPDDEQVLLPYGQCLREQKKTDEATQVFDKILTKNPDNTEAQQEMVLLCWQKKDFEKAEKYALLLIQKNPENPQYLTWLASSLEAQGRYSESAKVFEKLLTIQPKDMSTVLKLGYLYDRQALPQKAEERYRQAIQAFPDKAEGYNHLGYMFAERGERLDEAEQLIRKALELSPNSGDILDSLAWVFFKRGSFAEAETELLKALELKGKDPIMLEHLGEIIQAQGRVQEAIERWQEALLLDAQDEDKNRIRGRIEKALPGVRQ